MTVLDVPQFRGSRVIDKIPPDRRPACFRQSFGIIIGLAGAGLENYISKTEPNRIALNICGSFSCESLMHLA